MNNQMIKVFRRTTMVLMTTILLSQAMGLYAQLSTHEIPFGILNGLDAAKITSRTFNFKPSMIDSIALAQDFPMLAGVSIPVGLVFSKEAVKTELDDGSTLWQLKFEVPQAKHLGVAFSELYIPDDDKLYIYSDTGKNYIGAFTSKNNSSHGYFSTHILPASVIIIEYHAQNTLKGFTPDFVIDEMIYVFSDFMLHQEQQYLKSSGACNVNMNCSEGQLWKKQKRGVAQILLKSGTQWFNCTGSLVNNTEQDAKPYILTADHCGTNSSPEDIQKWQFYFNYEYSGCENSGTAPRNMMLTGAELKAKSPIQGGSDFKLLLLNQNVPKSWNPYYNGWTRSETASEYGVGIHHPQGDPKKISTYTNPLTSTTFTGGLSQGYWRVVWSQTISGHGITEPGSSGSPLFDPNGLIVGTLTGGSASCTAPTQPDVYGKLGFHWSASGETSDKNIKAWLDPNNDDPAFLYGYDPNAKTNFVIVDVSPQDSGNIKGEGYYAESENVTLSAKPNTGFVFQHWYSSQFGILSDVAVYEFTMDDREVLITAVFAIANNLNDDHVMAKINAGSNPVSNILNLEIANAYGIALIALTNLSGQIVTQFEVSDIHSNSSIPIDVSGIKNGLYILTVRVNEEQHRKKIIINQ
jgi:hypothetical protein